jgi:excisionase family DNA binding protein
MPHDALTAAQAAQESGVKKRTIQYNLLRGLLKGYQIPGSGVWLIDRDDFEVWLAQRDRQQQER